MLLLYALTAAAWAQTCARVEAGEVVPMSLLVEAPCVELAPRPATQVVFTWGGTACGYPSGRFALASAVCYPDPSLLVQSAPMLTWTVDGRPVYTAVTGAPEALTGTGSSAGGVIFPPRGEPVPVEAVLFRPGQRPMRLSASQGRYPAPGVDLDGAWVLADTQAYPVPPGPQSRPVAPSPAPSAGVACALGEAERASLEGVPTQLVCVDRTRPGVAPVLVPPTGTLLPPNTTVVVRLRCPAEGPCDAALGGSAGYTAGSVDRLSTTAASAGGQKSLDEDEAPPQERTELFAPRKPGIVQLTVTTAAGSEVVAEWVVPQPVGGAVRLGVSLGTVADLSFSAVTAPGSSTPEIVVDGGGWGHPELVLGWAPFLGREGRIYEDPSRPGVRPGRHNLAPYFGLGVLGLDGDAAALSLLSSAYLGVEWELRRSTSVALTAAVRRVDTLAWPFEVGGPADGDAVPTVSRWAPGLAVVFNLSPEFFEIARQPLGGS